MRLRFPRTAAVAVALLSGAGWASAANLMIEPSTFDFGWSPDNAKISAEFTVTNIASQMVPLTSVQPTCGCTASHFEPGALGRNESTKIGLTFNTRGYSNMPFNKATTVKTDASESPYSVRLAGHVTNAAADLQPEGDGIAQFDPAAKSTKQTLHLLNMSGKPLTLEVVQEPAAWAKVRSKNSVIPPGGRVPVDVSVTGSLAETRETSITIAGKSDDGEHRVTLAIRTGEPPRPYRIPPPSAKPKPQPKVPESK